VPAIITEDMIEQASIELLTKEYPSHYTHINCYTQKNDTLPDGTGRDDKMQVVLPKILFESLCRLNPDIPLETIQNKANELCRITQGDLLKENYDSYQKIKDGIPITFKKDGKDTHSTLRLIDFTTPANNSFIIASQMWIKGKLHWRRPDLLIFVNGLPLVFIELKNSTVNVKTAHDKNLNDYLSDIPWLFHYNQICVLSNGLETRLGSFKASYRHFFEWWKIADEKENPDRQAVRERGISLEYFLRGLCKPETLLDYIENFILFDIEKGKEIKKIIAKNHQFLGVNNAFQAFENRHNLGGKLGVFWHTQGSGKSYSMVMLASKIRRKCTGNFTFLIVTDREDLDHQIYKTFMRCGLMSANAQVQPRSSLELRKALKTNAGILFTMIHKFRYDWGQDNTMLPNGTDKTLIEIEHEKKYPLLHDGKDREIIVFVDEAHRTQYKELAENMRAGLPFAHYLAFTGTPLLGSKRKTHAWFGDYVSEYNFAESVKDNATVPLYYIKRVPEVLQGNEFLDYDLDAIVDEYDLSEEAVLRLENHYARLYEVIKRDDRLEAVAQHIVYHFPRRGFLGKGMVVCVDKFTAVKLYDKVTRLWKEEIKKLNSAIKETPEISKKLALKKIVDYMRTVEMAVVISEDADEVEKFKKEGLSISPHRQRINKIDDNGADIEDNFKDENHPLSLVFLCSMWLTGFDVPCVSTMYLDKPMKGHTLMQTIARANRVFEGKENGLIVDFLNVFHYLKNALALYAPSSSGESGAMPVKNIKALYNQLNESVDITLKFCSAQGIDLSRLLSSKSPFKNLSLFGEFADKIVEKDDTRNEFKVLSTTVAGLYDSLRPDIIQMDFDKRYTLAIKYLRGIIDGKISPDTFEKVKEHTDKLLDDSIIVEEEARKYIIDEKGKEIDLTTVDIDKLSEKFRHIKNPFLEISVLREHIQKKIEQMQKVNTTRKSFAERLQHIIDEYNAGGSKANDYYDKLVELMKDIREEEKRHIAEGLSDAELEIFDLLRKEKLTKKEESQVKLAACELYKTLQDRKRELFVVGWYTDPQPKAIVHRAINETLHTYLPECYEPEVFREKSDIVYQHIVEQAMLGEAWVG